jgi:hypothetical protein
MPDNNILKIQEDLDKETRVADVTINNHPYKAKRYSIDSDPDFGNISFLERLQKALVILTQKHDDALAKMELSPIQNLHLPIAIEQREDKIYFIGKKMEGNCKDITRELLKFGIEKVFDMVVSVVDYLSQFNIFYYDIKLDNILYEYDDLGNLVLKVSDIDGALCLTDEEPSLQEVNSNILDSIRGLQRFSNELLEITSYDSRLEEKLTRITGLDISSLSKDEKLRIRQIVNNS